MLKETHKPGMKWFLNSADSQRMSRQKRKLKDAMIVEALSLRLLTLESGWKKTW
jgi:hypothetical protein